MKVITSYGGPFVGLDSNSVAAWSGIGGKRFIGDASPYANDYEAGGALTNGRQHAPCNTAKIDGEMYSAFLISIGFDLFLMRADPEAIFMFQVEYADADWLESSVSDNDFACADFDPRESVSLIFETDIIHIFDSVGEVHEFEKNRLDLSIKPGRYTLYTSIYQPDENTQLFLHKLIRDN